MVVSHEAKNNQHALVFFGLCDRYSELFMCMTALSFENTVTHTPQQFHLLNKI